MIKTISPWHFLALFFIIFFFINVLLLTGCGKPEPSESLSEAKDDTPLEHAQKHLDIKYV